MALDIPKTTVEDIPDADVIDVEEVGRLEQLKTRAAGHKAAARVAFAGQREIVSARVGSWFRTSDVTDEHLAEQVEARRRKAQQQGEMELRARIRTLKAKLRTAGEDSATGIARDLETAETQLAIRQEETEEADRFKVTGRDLGRARWGKKAGRLGIVLGAGYAGLQGIAVEPLLALVALGAGPVGWWYLSRPVTADEKAAEIPGQQVMGPDGMPVSLLKDGTAAPVPFLPPTLAEMSRVSLVKRDAGRVQGESDLITALIKAGIVNEAERDQTHLAGVIEPSGPGWTATIELPRGAKASTAVSKVEDLASALRIKKTRIEIKADTSTEGHEGRFVLWVANDDNPYGSQKTYSELIKAADWDFWQQGIPMGADARAKRATMHLLWNSLLVGGLMGYGKSYMVRLIAAAAALDPTVRIIVVTGKTGPDWAPLRNVAHQWIAGASPDIIRRVLGVMEQTITEMQDRGSELDRLYEEDPEKAPEGKITPELAKEGMGPVLLIVDELQELLDGAALIRVPVDDDRDPDESKGGRVPTRSGKDVLVEAFARYVRVTRFVGGMGAFITQRPDANSVPTALREVCAKRGSYRVKGDKSAKMVLGDDAVAAGAAPHMLGEASKGVVVLDEGGEQGHATLKVDVIDLPEFKEIALRGRQLRIDAGTLTGDATEYGKASAAVAAARQLLADCLDVLEKAGTERVRTEVLHTLLTGNDPDRYGELTPAQLQALLKPHVGVTRKLGPIDGMKNPNGYFRDDIAEAHQKTGK